MARASIRVPFYNDDYLNKRLETHQTTFEVLRGKIAAVISDSEIEEYRNGNITMASKLSSAIQTVDGFSQEVSELQTAYDAATGEFNTLVSKVSQFEQTVDGFTQTVSRVENKELSNSEALEFLSGQVSGLSQNMSNYVLRTSLKSEIEQTAGSIDLSVFRNTTMYTKTQVDNKLNLYTPTSGLIDYIKSNKSSIGITDEQILLTVTGSQAWGDNANQISNLQTVAQAANELAELAKAKADIKNNVYYGSSTPTGTAANPLVSGDLWVNSVYTTDSATGKTYYKTVLKRYNPSSNPKWVEINDTGTANALALAGNAKAIADGKIKTYQQTSPPEGSASDPLDAGDLWLDTDDGNRLYRWSGSAWFDVRDTGIKAANDLAQAAKELAAKKTTTYYASTQPKGTTANPLVAGDLWYNSSTKKVKRYSGSEWVDVTDPEIANALTAANTAQSTADGKINTYSQPEPGPQDLTAKDVGDIWINTTDGKNIINRWDGSKWVNLRDSGIKAANDLATAAQTLASKKTTTYYTTSQPQGTAALPLVTGDLWYNSSTKKVKRYNGSLWIDVTDPDIAKALNDAADAQSTADGKIMTHYGPDMPTDLTNQDEGDLWVDTDDNNNLWRWNGSQWVDIHDKNIDAINKLATDAKNLAEGKIKTWYQSQTPSNPTTGDMWIDTTKKNGVAQNILKRYDGTKWEIVDNANIAQLLQDTATISAVADRKIMTYTGTEAPKGTDQEPLDEGDLWIETSIDPDTNKAKNLLYRYDKTRTEWKSYQDGDIKKISDIVATKITTYYGSSLPTGTVPKKGDLWIDTTKDSNNKVANVLKRYSGSQWQKMDSPYILEAYNNAATAQATADRKIETYLQAEPPQGTVAEPLDEGDLWIDSNDGNRMYIYSSGSWVDVQDQAIQRLSDDLDDVIGVVNGKITTYYDSSEPKPEKYPNLTAGDLWFTTKKVYPYEGSSISETKRIIKRYNGSQWVEYSDTLVENALGAASNAQSTADLKVQVFTGSSFPQNNTANNLDTGDLFINTSDNNKMYMWQKSGSGGEWKRVDTLIDELAEWKRSAQIELTEDGIWSTITESSGGATKIVNMINQSPSTTTINSDKIRLVANSSIDLLISEKSTTFYQDSFPERIYDSTTGKYNVNVGDVCYRTDQNNRAYICRYAKGSTLRWAEADSDKVLQSNVIASINADSSGVQIKGSKIKLEASDEITLAVNNAKTYADTQATAAKNAAISDTNTKLTSYTKTADLKIGINGIQTKVIGANIDLNGTKTAAVNAANSDTDTKLTKYTKTTELMSYINQQAGSIEIAVVNNLSSSLSQVQSTANTASSTANTAKSTAETAKSTADTAKTTANTANSTANTAKNTADTAKATADTAKSTANTAKSTADTAKNTADTAKTTADTAKSTAETKNTIFRQGSTNPPTGIKTGDMWYDTSHGSKCYIWNGSAWVAEDLITRINLTESTATINADKINIAASSNLRLMVTGKNKIFCQNDEPSARVYDSITQTYNINIGDIWYDKDDQYKMYVCSAVTSTSCTWTLASQDKVAKTGVISAINLTQETASIKASKIELTTGADLTNRLNDANSNAKVFRSSSEPKQSKTNGIRNIEIGDIWYNTTSGSNKMYFCSAATDTSAEWTPDSIINRINMSTEGIAINANKLNINADSIRLQAKTIRWSSDYSTMTQDGVLTSTDNASSPSLTIVTHGRLEFTRTSTNLGRIGTNNVKDNSSYKGLVFDLKYAGSYMAWACDSDNDGNYNWKWVYTRKALDGYAANTLHALVPINTHGKAISTYEDSGHRGSVRSRFKSSDGTFGLATATINIYGMIVTVNDGIITNIQKGTNNNNCSWSTTKWET